MRKGRGRGKASIYYKTDGKIGMAREDEEK